MILLSKSSERAKLLAEFEPGSSVPEADGMSPAPRRAQGQPTKLHKKPSSQI
jgi:hypothetical protein